METRVSYLVKSLAGHNVIAFICLIEAEKAKCPNWPPNAVMEAVLIFTLIYGSGLWESTEQSILSPKRSNKRQPKDLSWPSQQKALFRRPILLN